MLRLFRRGQKEQENKEKTEQAVSKTRKTWFRRMTHVFQRSHIDDDLWDELEEILISADVGVHTTEKLLERLLFELRSLMIF